MHIQSVPVTSRQIGDLQCNIDRLKIVAALAKTISNVDSLASAGAKSVFIASQFVSTTC